MTLDPVRLRSPHRAILLVTLSSALLACGAPEWDDVLDRLQREFPEVERVSTDELAGMLSGESGPRPVLLDTRTKEEFEVSHLPGAILAPDEDAALEALREVDPDRPVVAYCSVGDRSSALAQRLRERGYRVSNLEGSIFAWANEGRPVYRGDRQVEQVHPYDSRWGTLLDERLRYDPQEAAP